MAKINKFIASYTDILEELEIPMGEGLPPKAVIRRFLRIFKTIDDSRIQAMIDYPMEEIILIAFLAILGNASTWTEMESFGKKKQRWLKKFLRLKNGIPSHDTFRRVFSLIDTVQLQEATVAFLLENLHAIKKALAIKENGCRQICVDGKEQRGTGRNYDSDEKIRNLQTLHIYDASNEICLYSEAIDEKTNEIPVAQKALKAMDLKGCIVTFDALHTQKDTIAVICRQKGDYVGGLKENQSGLLEEAAAYFNEKELLDYYRDRGDFYETVEKAHGKLEQRSYYLVRPTKRKTIKEWKGLKAFICFIKKTKDKHGKQTEEIRYYISSTDDIELCATAIRGHWSVENNLHWHLDYSLYEDNNTTMDKTAFNNYSLINKMVLSLCKLAKPVIGSPSIRILRKEFGWGFEESLSMLLSSFDEEHIRNAMESVK